MLLYELRHHAVSLAEETVIIQQQAARYKSPFLRLRLVNECKSFVSFSFCMAAGVQGSGNTQMLHGWLNGKEKSHIRWEEDLKPSRKTNTDNFIKNGRAYLVISGMAALFSLVRQIKTLQLIVG